jgi:GMP synthase-like glutamine amidotransferase
VPVLARTALADQAFCWGRTLGLQFHPELTPSVLDCWLSVGGAEQLAELGVDAAALMERTRALVPGAAGRAHELVRRFVTDVTRRLPVPMPNATGVTSLV